MIIFSKIARLSVLLTILFLHLCHLAWAGDGHLLTVKVGVCENPPKVYTNANGEVVGIFPDLLKVIASEEGWQLEYVHGTLEQGLDRLSSGDIDVMLDIAFSMERAEKMSFSSENVFLNWGSLYTRKDLNVESLLDIKGKTVATVKGDIHTVGENGILNLDENFDLGLQFIYTSSYEEVLQLVDTGAVDAGVVNRLFGTVSEDLYSVNKSSVVFNSVRLKYAVSDEAVELGLLQIMDDHIHKLKQDPDSVFHSIINSYLAGIEYNLKAYYEFSPLTLSDEELGWLEKGQTIRVGVDPAYAPYSYRGQNGTYQGLAVDVIQLVAKHLGLSLEIVAGLSWSEVVEGAKDKNLDVILTAVKTDSRLQFLNFTDVYLPTPLVIMTRENNFHIEGPEDIAGKRVALVTGYSVTDRLSREYPGISAVMVDTPLEGLAAVSAGEADCYVGVLGVVDYLLREGGISNLKVAGRYDMLHTGKSLAVRKDWPQLLTILDRALKSISEKKHIELHNEWIFGLSHFDGPAALQEENVLTAKETEWVQNHKNILLGVDPEFAPFEFFDDDGQYQGITAEYVQILNKRLGLQMRVVPDLSWNEVVEKAKKKELDVLPIVGKTRERQEYLHYTKPYMGYHRVVISRSDMPFISSVADIEDLKVAVQKHSSHDGFLREISSIEATEYPTLLEGLKAVSEGRADAFVGNLASATYWIRKVGLTNLKVAGPVSHSKEHLYFSVRKDWPELIGILEKGLASISSAKTKEIRERWVSVEYEPGISPQVVFNYFLQAAFVIFFVVVIVLASNKRLKKEITKREKVEHDLTYRLISEKLLSRVASRFIGLKGRQLGTLLEETLADIAELLTADSAYLLTVVGDKDVCVSHSWHPSGSSALGGLKGSQPLGESPLIDGLYAGDVTIYNGADLSFSTSDTDDEGYHPLWEKKVGMILPIFRGDALSCLFWFTSSNDQVGWQKDDVTLLTTIGLIVTNVLDKIDVDCELREHRNMLEQRIDERTEELEKTNLQLVQEIADRIQADQEKERLQRQLFHTQKLESIGTLAGGIAHEFNNILTVILGNTEVTRGLSTPDSAIRDNLERILEAGGRAKKLVLQILTFSRASTAEPKLIFPAEVLSEALQMLRPTIPSTIEIIEDYGDEESCIFVDPSQLNQVLINLCTNAYHAMEESGGRLKVSLGECLCSADDLQHELDIEPGCFVRISVADSGCGISGDDADKVFDPFFTTKKVGKGTGLGLSIVHGIVNKSGGFIKIESSKGKGATFHLYFPSQTKTTISKGEVLPYLLKGRERILLVDDERAIASVNKNLIETMGYKVTVSSDGKAAMDLFMAEPERYDLVITDQTMPGMNGMQLAANLLEIRPSLKVILCTGYSSLIDRETAESVGVKGLLLKPFSRQEVGQMIRELCD